MANLLKKVPTEAEFERMLMTKEIRAPYVVKTMDDGQIHMSDEAEKDNVITLVLKNDAPEGYYPVCSHFFSFRSLNSSKNEEWVESQYLPFDRTLSLSVYINENPAVPISDNRALNCGFNNHKQWGKNRRMLWLKGGDVVKFVFSKKTGIGGMFNFGMCNAVSERKNTLNYCEKVIVGEGIDLTPYQCFNNVQPEVLITRSLEYIDSIHISGVFGDKKYYKMFNGPKFAQYINSLNLSIPDKIDYIMRITGWEYIEANNFLKNII